MRTIALLVAMMGLTVLLSAAQAQMVCVILSPDTTTVVSGNAGCNPGSTSISTADTRWTAWQAKLSASNLNDQYNAAKATQLALGFILVSTGNNTLNAAYPLDPVTQDNLQGYYLGIFGTAIFQGSISSTTLTVSSVSSGALAIGEYVTGTGVAPATQITSGSGSSWTVNNSQSVSSEWMIGGGLGSGIPTGSAVSLADLGGTIHSFTPIQFLNYKQAVGAYLGGCTTKQAWVAAGDSFAGCPNPPGATIP